MESVLDELKVKLQGKVLILGIGNPFRKDDGFGSILAKSLKDKIKQKVIDVKTTPENYLGSVVKNHPDTILIIDAVDFKEKPGAIRIFSCKDILTSNLFFTHNLSPYLLINFLKESLKANIIFLGIQPKQVNFGKGLTQELKKMKIRLEHFFKNLYG
jgi:hydrogenase 3 maturation protease